MIFGYVIMEENEKVVDVFSENFQHDFLPLKPLITSYNSGWKNINLIHTKSPLGEIPEHISLQHTIAIPTSIPRKIITVPSLINGKMYPVQSYIGTMNLDPAYTPRKLIHEQISEAIILSLDPESVLSIDPDHINPDRIELFQSYGKEDPLIFQIGQALKKEIESGSYFQAYIESLTISLSAHLLRHYSTTKYDNKEYKGGLSKNKLGAVVEYINSYLSEDISMNILARISGLSQFYFSRQFKKSMGISPYQYIVKQRVEKAKYLLAQDNLGIAEIALICGFTHQSHLNRHFKCLTGTTPKKYRDLTK